MYWTEGQLSQRRVGAEPKIAEAVKIYENELNEGCSWNEMGAGVDRFCWTTWNIGWSYHLSSPSVNDAVYFGCGTGNYF